MSCKYDELKINPEKTVLSGSQKLEAEECMKL